MSKKALHALLGSQIVGYHPLLAKISGGASEGVLLSQLLYWESKMDHARGADWDGWFWKVANELYDETGMTRREFETARANLIKRGFIAYESRGVPMRAHYRMNLDAITSALESADEFAKAHARKFIPKGETAITTADGDTENTQPLNSGTQFVHYGQTENEHVQSEQTDVSIMDKPECSKSANQNAQNVQTIQENTSLDSQKNPKEDVILEIKSLFTIPGETEWDWLDALLLEIPDKKFLENTAHRVNALCPGIFSEREFTRVARFDYARLNR